MNEMIHVLPQTTPKLIHDIIEACRNAEITWEQRVALVNIAARDEQEARELLSAWRREG